MHELIHLETLIWLLPVAFFIHDAEEILTVEQQAHKHRDHPAFASQIRLLDWNKSVTLQFTVAVLLMGSILLLVTSWQAAHFDGIRPLHALFLGIVAVVLLDGVKHVGVTVAIRSYTPGVITALFVEIPYGAYALYRFYEAGLAPPGTILLGIAMALPLVALLIWTGLTVGNKISPRRKPL
ncbi:HXXEE domain-containing protein [Paenibacillus filicis]|uniref:HXXEE domain-containing protein n=1 Tax=Paenibacillus filicis TaxID=669464 RepID=A0ABU9DF07_9BACL